MYTIVCKPVVNCVCWTCKKKKEKEFNLLRLWYNNKREKNKRVLNTFYISKRLNAYSRILHCFIYSNKENRDNVGNKASHLKFWSVSDLIYVYSWLHFGDSSILYLCDTQPCLAMEGYTMKSAPVCSSSHCSLLTG